MARPSVKVVTIKRDDRMEVWFQSQIVEDGNVLWECQILNKDEDDAERGAVKAMSAMLIQGVANLLREFGEI